MSIQKLVSASRRYGADSEYVVAGGGNTSWKNQNDLYIKGSGTALESIDESGFVRMDRARLAAIWTNDYPDDPDARESAVLCDLMAARRPGEEAKRPSVETLLHDILPYSYVVHTHPSLVNGITCSQEGESAARRLFGDDALWVPYTTPGYILSKVVKDACKAHEKAVSAAPAFILLQNHGIFVAADSIEEIDAIYDRVMKTIAARATRRADFSGAVGEFGPSAALREKLVLLASTGAATASVYFRRDNELARLSSDRTAFSPVASALSPDHIVYAGSDPLYVDAELDEGQGLGALDLPGDSARGWGQGSGAVPGESQATASLENAWKAFVGEKKRNPKLVAVRGVGVFGVGANMKSARLAVDLFMDAAKVAAFTEAFGGPHFMTAEQIDFINNWEVERYRSQISSASK